MILRRSVLGLIAGGAAVLLTGCDYFPSKHRFLMTVEIETPEGVKSGSSVYEETAYKNFTLTAHERSGGGSLRGQALVVELPDGPIFVLMRLPRPIGPLRGKVTRALVGKEDFLDIDEYVAAVRKLGDGGRYTAELPKKHWPMMVRFGDINDPKSVQPVDPQAIGVRRIIVETSDNEVTTGIEKRLGWLTDGTTLNAIWEELPDSTIDILTSDNWRRGTRK